ncbi:MAG: hypothetical protein LBR28_00820 [Bacteroidales bacterium]|jgi:hypothetical protein|nr:hypothetical protein [Bacteroidales bacterium]
METNQDKESKDQFIIACISNFKYAEKIIQWSCLFAKILDKGLILLHISDPQYTNITTEEAEISLQILNKQIKDIQTHSYLALKGKTKKIIHSLGEMLSAVLMVSFIENNHNSVHQTLKNFSQSRIAYFIFNEKTEIKPFKNVLLPMNMLREAKEKVLWAGYFGRFAKSTITIFHKKYKDEFHQQQLNANIKFAVSMLENFNIKINIMNYSETNNNQRKNADLDVLAIDYAEKCKYYDLIICQTTKNKSILNLFSQLAEHKTLLHSQSVPVLFLNPRDDLFVLCE